MSTTTRNRRNIKPSGRSSSQGSSRPHFIAPSSTRDQVSSGTSQQNHRGPKLNSQEDIQQQELQPQLPEQEELKQLETLQSDLDQIEEAPDFNPVAEFSDASLDLSKPNKPESEQTGSTTFRPTIGTPDQKSSSSRDSRSEVKDSSYNSEGTETKSLSDIINQSKNERLESLNKKDTTKRTGLARLNFVGRGRSRLRKYLIGLAISGFAAAATAIIGLLPTALDSVLTSATTAYSNFSTEGIIKKAFNDHFKEDVLVPLCRKRGGSGEKCNVQPSKKNGLFGRAREDMRANRIDQKLLDAGIQWDYNPDRDEYTFFQTKDGSPLELDKHRSLADLDMFALGPNEGSKFIDSKVREVINNESRWKKYFIRGPTLRAMRTRTGSNGCFFLCKTKDSWNNTKKWPKKAFGRFVKQHILWPSSKLLSAIVDCMIGAGASCLSRSFHTYARGIVGSAAAKLFNQEFADEVLNAFDGAANKGVTRFVMEEALKKFMDWLSIQISEKAATNVVGLLLLIKTIGELVERLATQLPKVLRIKNLMTIALVSSTFMIIINEARRGTLPLADFGSLLSTFIGMGRSRIFASIFMGEGNKTAQNGQPYSCNNAEDGGVIGAVSGLFSPAKMAAGDLTCKSFMLDYIPTFIDNPLIQGISNSWRTIKEDLCAGPICLGDVFKGVDWVQGLAGSLLSKIFSFLPGVDELKKYISEKFENLASTLLGAVTPSIVTDAFSGTTSILKPQGARVFDALVGGTSAINQYITPRDELGGGPLSQEAQLELDSHIATQQAQDTKYASAYDRFFNLDPTTGPGTSLLANVAVSSAGSYSIANLLNPFQNLSMAFSGASGYQAYASNNSIARIASSAFAVPVRNHQYSKIVGMSKGTIDIPDPDSPECKAEIATWKQQIEDRTDSTVEGEADSMGFGIPDGDGSKTSSCMLADASLKVLTTHSSTTDDFPQDATDQDSSLSSGTSGSTEPNKPGSGQCPNVPVTRPNEGKANDVLIQVVPGTSIDHRADLCLDALAMIQAAAADGVTLNGGGFRTYEEQVQKRIDNCGSSDYAIYQMPSGMCHPPTARPGTSNHETGQAIDFANCGSRSTACYKWLAANAARFGYYNLPSESWHWSRTGG